MNGSKEIARKEGNALRDYPGDISGGSLAQLLGCLIRCQAAMGHRVRSLQRESADSNGPTEGQAGFYMGSYIMRACMHLHVCLRCYPCLTM